MIVGNTHENPKIISSRSIMRPRNIVASIVCRCGRKGGDISVDAVALQMFNEDVEGKTWPTDRCTEES